MKLKKLTAVLLSIGCAVSVISITVQNSNKFSASAVSVTEKTDIYLRYDGLTDYLKNVLTERQVFYEIKDSSGNLILTVRSDDIINETVKLNASLAEMMTWAVDVKNLPKTLQADASDLFRLVYAKENGRYVLRIKCPEDKDVSLKVDVTAYAGDIITTGYNGVVFDTIEYSNNNNIICLPYGRQVYIKSKRMDTSITFSSYNKSMSTVNFTKDIGNGDINGDGDITLKDISALSDYLLGRGRLSTSQFYTADMNGDGKVNVFDMVYLKRAFLKK